MIGDIELFAATIRGWKSKVIAITGANGKTTVTTLVGQICMDAGLETVVAGNIGLCVLDALSNLNGRQPDVFVLELSSFQLETVHSLRPDVAVVLNVTEDHMDRYHGMEEYAAAKARIFHGDGVMVLNRQDQWCRNMAQAGATTVWLAWIALPAMWDYGLTRRHDELWLARGSQPLLPVGDMQLIGLHNAANALAAAALATQSASAMSRFWKPCVASRAWRIGWNSLPALMAWLITTIQGHQRWRYRGCAEWHAATGGVDCRRRRQGRILLRCSLR